VGAVPLLAAGLAVLTACGGSDETAPATDPATTASATASATPNAFADCMTQQGVPAPEGGVRVTGPGGGEPEGGTATRRNPPEGVEPDAWAAALETCGPLATRRTVRPTP
jgi:hypothetical protein